MNRLLTRAIELSDVGGGVNFWAERGWRSSWYEKLWLWAAGFTSSGYVPSQGFQHCGPAIFRRRHVHLPSPTFNLCKSY